MSKHTFWEPQTWIQKKCRWRGFRDSLLHKWSMLWFHVDLKKTFRSTYEKTCWDGKKKNCLGRPKKLFGNFGNISSRKRVFGNNCDPNKNFFTTVCKKKTFNFTRGTIKSPRIQREDSPSKTRTDIRADVPVHVCAACVQCTRISNGH